MNPQIDDFLQNATQWRDEMTELRRIVLDCGLEEAYKWKQPCYMYNQTNVMLISAFKAHAILSFLKGALMADTEKLLIRPGENSHSSKYLSFTSVDEILSRESTIKAYIFEAIEIEKAGLKVDTSAKKTLNVPEELEQKFTQQPELKLAFESLTPGRQRGYLMFFNAAKQSKTKTSRIEQYTERILKGKGFHDCVCGHSKRMPTCDGSHKYL